MFQIIILFACISSETTTHPPTSEESRSGSVAGYLFLAFVFTIVLSVMMWHCVQHRSGYRKQIRRCVGIERFTPLPSSDGDVSRVVSMANLLVDGERNFHALNCESKL